MLDDIFGSDELPNYKLYEVAQEVVSDYMENKHCKIDKVAADIGTTTGVLYRRLNPKDTTMPLSIDSIISITHLTKDKRIIEAICNEFDSVMICKKHAKVKATDINLLVDMANIENADVFREVKKSIADGVITEDERKRILKEIDEAEKANAELKDTVLQLAIDEK